MYKRLISSLRGCFYFRLYGSQTLCTAFRPLPGTLVLFWVFLLSRTLIACGAIFLYLSLNHAYFIF